MQKDPTIKRVKIDAKILDWLEDTQRHLDIPLSVLVSALVHDAKVNGITDSQMQYISERIDSKRKRHQ
ncbi:hypothetical protein HOP61_13370 [Halomonas daqingensis]|uniref:Uncharacterized protein n=1 Tax=Billgrantia desiderata TaxID=52021 RepID=A0AAW4YVA0_9GAMM|nr:hypothetical protein [Halomonas desiderata]MCE8052295.1 hypothetical protein [Halomonas desiderata]